MKKKSARRKPARRWTLDAIVGRMKSDIVADITAGRMPAHVRTFSALHDHVDANEYGGLCDPDCPFDAGTQADADTINAAQDEVDSWLRRRPMLHADAVDLVSRALSVIVESDGADEHAEIINDLRRLVDVVTVTRSTP
jgi:hypothetical protein